MKYCEHCGSKIEGKIEFCSNCGAKLNTKEIVEGTIVNQNNNSNYKDNTLTALVCSLIGCLCCTYIAIPGLVLSITSLKDINEGKISKEKKWMAIVGIVLSSLGILQMIINLIHPNQAIIDRVNEIFNK